MNEIFIGYHQITDAGNPVSDKILKARNFFLTLFPTTRLLRKTMSRPIRSRRPAVHRYPPENEVWSLKLDVIDYKD